MPQDTSPQNDDHLSNDIFAGICAFIELLYHLTHISLSYLKHVLAKGIYHVLYCNSDELCRYFLSALTELTDTVLVGKAMNITEHLSLQNTLSHL